jgi:hypothetical protein
VLDENNELDDLTLYALGLLTEEDIDAIIDASVNGKPMPETSASRWTYEEICALTFKTIFPYQFYMEGTNGTYSDVSENPVMLDVLYKDAMELKVVGIIKPAEDADTAMLSGSIAYTHALTRHIITEAITSDVVAAQMANPDYDILTGLPFKSAAGHLTNAEKKTEFEKYKNSLSDAKKVELLYEIACLTAINDPERGLDVAVQAQLDGMTDKAALVDMIIQGLEDTDVNSDTVRGYFEERTLDELKTMLRPTIEKMSQEGILCYGPFPADGFMGSANYTRFDGVLAMYHDQGLAPMKALGMDDGVNFTAGLSVVRTSPAHGVAYDIAGKGVADAQSMRNAIYTAIDIVRNRNEWDEWTANPLQRFEREKGRDISVKDLKLPEQGEE